MFFCRFEKEYLPAIAELEAKAYPAGMVLGLSDFEKDMEEKNLRNYSVAGFSKGELVCYIAAYVENPAAVNERCIYISDINCKNPFYLKRLLLFFFAESQFGSYPFCFTADMRECSYRLLGDERKRKQRGITVLKETYLPGYYSTGEGVHKVTFQMDLKRYLEENWKDAVQLLIDRQEHYWGTDILKSLFRNSEIEGMKHVDFREEKNMRFVLDRVKEAIVDYYYMFSEKIPVKIVRRLPAKFEKTLSDEERKKKYANTVETYKKYGFDEQNWGPKSIWYDYYWETLKVSKTTEALNTRYRESLSGLRWVWKNEKRFFSSQRYFDTAESYNRYGVIHPMIKVPYLTRNYYIYLVGKMYFVREKEEDMEALSGTERYCFNKMCDEIYWMLPGKEARECIEHIIRQKSDDAGNFFHDWELLTASLAEARDILTKGAVKSILGKSYRQAVKLSKYAETVMNVVTQGEKIRKPLDKKEIRKVFSSLLRRNKDCAAYVDGLTAEMERKYRLKLQLPVSEENKVIDFLERMKRYCQVTFYDVFCRFGVRTLGKFVKGTYPCTFLPQEIQLSYGEISAYAEKLLKIRTRQTKHLYQKLSRTGLLEAVMKYELTREQCREVLDLFKLHNVKLKDPAMKEKLDFRVFIEQKGSPEFLTAGDASVCCMGFGSMKAHTYATEKGFGIINAYYKERVVANSLIWINEPYQCLVLDNIEVHPNYKRFSDILEQCFLTAAEKLMWQYDLKFAVQGERYNDLVLYGDDSPTVRFPEMKAVDVEVKNFYTDAETSRVICQNISNKKLSEIIDSNTACADKACNGASEREEVWPQGFLEAA